MDTDSHTWEPDQERGAAPILQAISHLGSLAPPKTLGAMYHLSHNLDA